MVAQYSAFSAVTARTLYVRAIFCPTVVMLIDNIPKPILMVLRTGLALMLLAHASVNASSAADQILQFPASLKACGGGVVATVLSGDRFRLKSGEFVTLAEVKAPEFWPPNAPYNSWPFGREAKLGLAAALKGVTLELFCAQRTKTMQGDRLAHVRLTVDGWLQKKLVKEGLAYYMPRGTAPKFAQELRRAEAEARAEQKGLWSYSGLSVKRADGNELRPGWFQIIVGKVVSVSKRKERAYLNFGDDWSEDFTVEIPKRLYRHFPETPDNKLGFLGKTIEVRGWVEWAGGAKIILEFADQIIIVPEGSDHSR